MRVAQERPTRSGRVEVMPYVYGQILTFCYSVRASKDHGVTQCFCTRSRNGVSRGFFCNSEEVRPPKFQNSLKLVVCVRFDFLGRQESWDTQAHTHKHDPTPSQREEFDVGLM